MKRARCYGATPLGCMRYDTRAARRVLRREPVSIGHGLTNCERFFSQIKKRRQFMRPKVRHVAVMTKNRQKMVEFYQKVFGLEPKRGFGGAIYMSDGDVNIALIEVKREDQQEGINHFGFEVDDLDEIKRRLKETGFNCEIDSKSDKDSDHRIQDPDGHWVDMAVHRRWPK